VEPGLERKLLQVDRRAVSGERIDEMHHALDDLD
jgi:hypothetical protein